MPTLALAEAVIREMALRDPQADALRRFASIVDPIDFRTIDRARVQRLVETGGLRSGTPYARLTFELATGVGKTRLMGAMMALLFRAGKARHFVILSPSSTIYDKIKREAQLGHPKYLFSGADLPPPTVVHDRNWTTFHPEQTVWTSEGPVLFLLTPGLILRATGKASERLMRQPHEAFGGSFVEYLASLPDLVVLLDEAHRFAQDGEDRAWTQAIEDLRPALAVGMTATPRSRGDVAYRYDLRTALQDGRYIKHVVCLYKGRPVHLQGPEHDAQWDQDTLREAVRVLERKRATLDTLAKENGLPPVKPILLVSCRDITHAEQIEAFLTSDPQWGRRFTGRVLRVDSSRSEETWLPPLLQVERPENPIEIVVNVGMLKEGWDVSNVYVIAPLRAMAAEVLTVQTIGRGLRLPYGRRVGEREADTLHVLAFGKETVQRVIEVAQRIGVDVEQWVGADRYPQSVSPQRPLTVPIPLVGMRTPRPDLRSFHPEAHVSVTPLADPARLHEIEAVTGRVTEVAGETIPADIENPARALAILLCRSVPELGGQEAQAESVFRDYFQQAGATSRADQNRLLFLRGHEVFEDVRRQAVDFLTRLPTEYRNEGTVTDFRFDTVTYHVSGRVTKDEARMPDHRDCLITGWEKELYGAIRLDSAPELTFARILDADPAVELWVRNPRGQLWIPTQVGRHSPDFFVAVTKDGFVLIEVKARRDIEESEGVALRRARAAVRWCEEVSRGTSDPWTYVLVPEDAVDRCASLQDLQQHRWPV